MIRASASVLVDRIYEFVNRHEYIVFGILILISLYHIWSTHYVMSLDGPQHLYNAHVLVELIKGNELFKEYFRVNNVIVGYWMGHFLLGFFKFFLPAWLAEKFFLTTYVIAMVYSFPYLIRSMKPGKSNLLIYLVFPFIFHSYFLQGYYSFSLGAIFYFLAIGFWLRKRELPDLRSMLIFGSLVLGVFLSHGLVFLFFGASLGILFLTDSIEKLGVIRESTPIRKVLNSLGRLLLSVAPAVVLWAIYIRSVMGINATVTPASYSSGELVGFLFRIRQLVGFDHARESPAYIILFVLLVILALYTLFIFIMKIRKGEYSPGQLVNSRNSWLFIMGMFLGFYFLLPDRISAGSLTNRFGLFFFFGLIVFLASQKCPKALQLFAVIVLIGCTTSTRRIHHEYLDRLDTEIMEMKEISGHIKEGSTMFSINTTNNWIHHHTQLLLVDDLSVIHLNNPQCAGQFPIVWNEKSLPMCFAGEKGVYLSGAPDITGAGHRVEQVDYITVFYYRRLWENESYQEWQDILSSHYELVTVSSGERAALYKRKE